MKGKVPDKIFLQIDYVGYDEFTSTWSEDRIDESDVEYVRPKQLPADMQKIIKKLEAEFAKKNSYYLMSPKEQKSIIEYIKTGE